MLILDHQDLVLSENGRSTRKLPVLIFQQKKTDFISIVLLDPFQCLKDVIFLSALMLGQMRMINLIQYSFTEVNYFLKYPRISVLLLCVLQYVESFSASFFQFLGHGDFSVTKRNLINISCRCQQFGGHRCYMFYALDCSSV